MTTAQKTSRLRGHHGPDRPESVVPVEYLTAAHRILILGGGFAGRTAAVELVKRTRRADDVAVLLVDRGEGMTFTPLLWTVAGGRAAAQDVIVPLNKGYAEGELLTLQTEVTGLDRDRKQVRTNAAVLPYDTLVIALGSVTAVPDLPGLRQHALVFRTTADALDLRHRLIRSVEAAHAARDPQERLEYLTFVVAGGGDTGVELAAVLQDYIRHGLMRTYPWLRDTPPRVVLIEREDRLLPLSDVDTSGLVQRRLVDDGVEILTGTRVTGVSDQAVTTSSGEIPTRTVVWAAGITAPDIVRTLDSDHGANGALTVDEYLRLPAHPDVYVLGDSASVGRNDTGEPVPPTAQAAEAMGRYVAGAIAARLAARSVKPFRFASRGHLVLLGDRTGVAQVGPVRFGGLPAWLIWHAYYLSHIPAWRNRVKLAGDWFHAALFGRRVGQVPVPEHCGQPAATYQQDKGNVAA